MQPVRPKLPEKQPGQMIVNVKVFDSSFPGYVLFSLLDSVRLSWYWYAVTKSRDPPRLRLLNDWTTICHSLHTELKHS